ncbi:hypothetical protein F2P46_06930 [Massilia sp. CCM 8734]|nr:hypothetical protein [Massilia sp. CCM 8734]
MKCLTTDAKWIKKRDKYRGRVVAALPGRYPGWFACGGFPCGEVGDCRKSCTSPWSSLAWMCARTASRACRCAAASAGMLASTFCAAVCRVLNASCRSACSLSASASCNCSKATARLGRMASRRRLGKSRLPSS